MNERGQATIFAIGLTIVVLAVAGLAIDGSKAFLLRRTLANAADGAARAGAGQIDERIYRSSGGRRVVLAPDAARSAVERSLRARGLHAEAEIAIFSRRVVVALTGSAKTSFLRLVGVDELRAAARAGARPISGAPQPGG